MHLGEAFRRRAVVIALVGLAPLGTAAGPAPGVPAGPVGGSTPEGWTSSQLYGQGNGRGASLWGVGARTVGVVEGPPLLPGAPPSGTGSEEERTACARAVVAQYQRLVSLSQQVEELAKDVRSWHGHVLPAHPRRVGTAVDDYLGLRAAYVKDFQRAATSSRSDLPDDRPLRAAWRQLWAEALPNDAAWVQVGDLLDRTDQLLSPSQGQVVTWTLEASSLARSCARTGYPEWQKLEDLVQAERSPDPGTLRTSAGAVKVMLTTTQQAAQGLAQVLSQVPALPTRIELDPPQVPARPSGTRVGPGTAPEWTGSVLRQDPRDLWKTNAGLKAILNPAKEGPALPVPTGRRYSPVCEIVVKGVEKDLRTIRSAAQELQERVKEWRDGLDQDAHAAEMEQAVVVYHLLRTQYLVTLGSTRSEGHDPASRELERQVRQVYEAVWQGFRTVDPRWAAPSGRDDHTNFVLHSQLYWSSPSGLRRQHDSKTHLTLGGWWEDTQEHLSEAGCTDTAAYADLHAVLYDGADPLLGRPEDRFRTATGLFALNAATRRHYVQVRQLAARLAWTASNVRDLPAFPAPVAQGPGSGTVGASSSGNCCPTAPSSG